MKTGEFFYERRGRQFRIYICDYSDNSASNASLVHSEPPLNDREEARKRVYELNGWKYTPRKC